VLLLLVMGWGDVLSSFNAMLDIERYEYHIFLTQHYTVHPTTKQCFVDV
jgi:hypothetical protein